MTCVCRCVWHVTGCAVCLCCACVTATTLKRVGNCTRVGFPERCWATTLRSVGAPDWALAAAAIRSVVEARVAGDHTTDGAVTYNKATTALLRRIVGGTEDGVGPAGLGIFGLFACRLYATQSTKAIVRWVDLDGDDTKAKWKDLGSMVSAWYMVSGCR